MASTRLLKEQVERAFGLAEGEAGKAARLVTLIFLVSASLVMLKSAQNSLFLMAYAKDMIPLAFIGSAAALTLVSLAMVPLAARIGTPRLAVTMLGACAIAMLLLRALLHVQWRSVPFITYVVIEAASGVLLIQAWSVVSQATHARSAKRLLPAAGAGATIAWALVGLLVPTLAHHFGTRSLLVFGALVLALATMVIQQVRTRDLPTTSVTKKRVHVMQEWKRAFRFIRSLPLLRVMTALSILALLTEQLMDYLLMSAAHERYTTDASCTAFFGRYYGITSAITLVFVLGLASRILLGLGTSRTLLLTPIFTIVFVFGALLAPGFIAVVALRGVDRIMKQSIWSSASEQTQTPIPALERVQSRSLVRGVLAPVAYATAAAALAAMPKMAETRWLALGVGIGVSIMGWLCIRAVKPAYQDALKRAIDERSLDFNDEAPQSFDAEARITLTAELSSTDDRRALLAAELLCDMGPTPEILRAAMRSSLPSVRVAVLESLTKHPAMGADDLLAHVLRTDPNEECRVAAARAMTLLGAKSARAREAIAETITLDASASVKAATRIASIALRDPAGFSRGSALVAAIVSGDDAFQLAALEMLGRTRSKNISREKVVTAVRSLLRSDASNATKLAAIDAAARLQLEELLPIVARLLELPEIGPDVVTRLVAWGGDALAFVERAAMSENTESVRFVASVLSASNLSAPLLVRLLSHADAEVRDRAVRTLAYAVADQKLPLPKEVDITPLLERELSIAFRMTIILAGIAQDDGSPDWKIDPPYDVLGHEIELEIRATRERILHLLTLVGNRDLASAIEVGLRRSSADIDAKIAELVDVSLPRALAKKVVPLFERLSLRERASAAGRAPELGDPLAAIVLLGDTVILGFAMLAYGDRFRQRFPDRLKELAPLIPLFERMAFLRTVPLFEEMPGHELRAVAEMLSVVELAEDETIFHKGEAGHDLFIVRRGSVSLRDGAVELAVAGEQNFFGELAILDNEPRNASAVTLEQTSLLRLRSADFHELMARRPQIQERVLKVVVRRLREASGRLTKA